MTQPVVAAICSLSRPAGPEAQAVELCSRAGELLDAGELNDYRELFEELPAIEDRHRRYWAAVNLVERGLAASTCTPTTQMADLLATVADGALQALAPDPCEPKLLAYAGVALYELWSLDAAQALFGAARRLDPQMEQVEANLARIALRRRQLRAAPRAARLHATLPDLERRAASIAAQAQPAQDLRLSLCMIVRDEQEMLPRCLTAVAGAVDEIVIVDTGSTDETVEIARSFGAHVIFHEWTGSFADARNVSLEAATGDWVLYLDADEILVAEDAELLRSLTGRTWREAFYLSEINYTGEIEDGTAVMHNALRVFRNRPEYRFEGRLHEQIAGNLPNYLPERIEASAVRVEHYGYLGAVRDNREKSLRNIELLRLQQAEAPPNAFLHYNLGSEYAAANQPEAALAEFERSWALLSALPDRDTQQFAPALISRLVKALRACGRPLEAIARAKEGLERFEGFTDLVLEQALAELSLGEEQRAGELLERCIEMGDAPRRYTATVGSGTYLPLIRLAELRRAAGDLDAAGELLERCAEEYPQFPGSVLPYASVLLAAGVPAEEVVTRLRGHMASPSPTARFMLGTALHEAGATVEAVAQFRELLERQPHSGRARVALGEALLAGRRYGEAATAVAAIAEDDPLAAIAARTELFARLAAGSADRTGDGIVDAGAPPSTPCGDIDELEDAFDRARAADMPASELDLFCAWRQLRESGTTSIELCERAVPALQLMLEALLRVHDFETFEVLLGALDNSTLAERERRELLAGMYLRRGFVASAAEEWMAVCAQEPDARALVGLARVAAARGMRREMSEFALAAHSCDPGNEDAVNMLAQVNS